MSFDGELNRIDDRLAYGAIDPLPDAFCKRFRFEHLEEAERVVEVVANELGFPKPGPREWRSEYGGFSARRVWAHPEPAYRLFAYCVPILDRALGPGFGNPSSFATTSTTDSPTERSTHCPTRSASGSGSSI